MSARMKSQRRRSVRVAAGIAGVWMAVAGMAPALGTTGSGGVAAGWEGGERFVASSVPLSLSMTAEPGAESSSGSAELAKKLSNPVADLISIPLQFNYDEGVGPSDAGLWRLNVQPVIPMTLNADWNLISRTILPVIYQESPAPGLDDEFGLGDTVQSFFFSPKEPTGGWIWGVGPVFNFPTATDTALGSGQWGVGPTAVVLKQESGWTYGVLANHLWSFAGDSDRESLNVTFLQPFLAYTFKTATTVTLNTESTYDWNDSEWTVPLNLMVSQVLRLGKLPVSVGLGGRWYADSPDGGPEWGARFVFTVLLPK